MLRSQLTSYGANDPVWGFVALVGTERFTGEAVVGPEPRVHLYASDGRIYYAERDGDLSVGARLVNCGALTAAQLADGVVDLGGVESLARLFHRQPHIDRDAVELTIEQATESLLEQVASLAVGTVEVFPLRHHPAGLHHWLRSVAAAPLVAPAPAVFAAPSSVAVAETAEPEPVAVEPVAVEPEPVAVEPEPEPIAVEPVPEPEPVAIEPEPEPEPVAADPEPVAVEPVAVDPEPEPEHIALTPLTLAPLTITPSIAPEPEPEPEPEPIVVASDPVEDAADTLRLAPPDLPPAPAPEPTVPDYEPVAPALAPLSLEPLSPVAEPPAAAEPAASAVEASAPAPDAFSPAPEPLLARLAPLPEGTPPLSGIAEVDDLPPLSSVAYLPATAQPSSAGPQLAAGPSSSPLYSAEGESPFTPVAPSDQAALPKLASAPIGVDDLMVSNSLAAANQAAADQASAATGLGQPHNLAAVEIWELVDHMLAEPSTPGTMTATGDDEGRGRGRRRGRKG